jgi:hypothetical protein
VGTTGVIFKFFFKTHALENIHGWLGLVLIAAAVLHISLNWPSLRNYFRDGRVFALLLPIVGVIAYFGLALDERLGGQSATAGVSPKEVVRELSHGSVSSVARVFGKDADSVIASMRRAGFQVLGADQTLEALAHENQKKPELILTYFVNKSGS